METIIVICLLLVIILLLNDKVVINKVTRRTGRLPPSGFKTPDIMGSSKPIERLSLPNKAIERLKTKLANTANNFETQTSEEDLDIVIPQEEPDEVLGELPDLEEEEEEWSMYREPNGEDGLATGVTFEELSTVGSLLQQEVLEPTLKQKAVDIVQRIQGTDLFSLLENSIENASGKIARLLDNSLNQQTEIGSSTLRKNGLDRFDIGEFV